MSDIVAPTSERSESGSSNAAQMKEGAAHAAHDIRDEVVSSAADVKDQAVSEIGHIKDEVTSQASDLLHQTREQVVRQADDGTLRLGEAFAAAGSELSGMAERSEQDGPMTKVVRQLGDRASSMGDRYQQEGSRALTDDVTGFARRNPGLFLLAAVGAGFVVGRIVRNADTKAIADAARNEPDPTPQLSDPTTQDLSRVDLSGAGATAPLTSDAAAEGAAWQSPATTGTVL